MYGAPGAMCNAIRSILLKRMMGISISNAALVQDMIVAVRLAAKSVYDGKSPSGLYHYTTFENVGKIIDSRTLWATCVAKQKNDLNELKQGIVWVKSAVDDIDSASVSPFVREVLRQIPELMELRRDWMFIACFCSSESSAFHWEHYGRYCLHLPIPPKWKPTIKLSDPRAEIWYQPVIYDHSAQRALIQMALSGIVAALAKNIRGEYGGPWMKTMTRFCARDAAQLLLSVAAGFKNETFKNDMEWRLICYPNLALGNSAPDMADENFAVQIKHEPIRHLKLQIQPSFDAFVPLRLPPIFFERVSQSPIHRNDMEREIIDQLLAKNGRNDMRCEKATLRYRERISRTLAAVFTS
jgi:hypothetical protein